MSEYDSMDFFAGREKTNYVQFYLTEKQDAAGKPVYKDYILIVSPGQNKQEVRRPVQDKDKEQYPAQWSAYQNKRETPLPGTPIEQLPGILPDRISLLKNFNVLTIEQMANLADGNLNNIGMGATALREQCRNWVKSNGPEMSDMTRQMKAMAERLEKLEKENAQLKASGGGGKRAA